ncbi:type VIII myosin heavy chain MyoC [Volvox carteri f. nagariensis]|uniref:Type VIII myosin heavy chain MyoC n=1 Tax=Volvox carteri f. nagariensis TaxID=3068 RepID=D8UBV8_VOLCA|nr:type VIII myosin heavy chain MyoC [Volvox carteri f. nagariensis]EFJ42839.1 type VIII myosin heavy chain MyoC [Volvox carteri f. nagariensis]|eukprot:XP_002956099.1 type VIII myosin heavy chain MyoC [Volvox carteri f. nagariensis]
MEALRGLGRGAKVFYRKDVTSWQQGELLAVPDNGTVSIQVGAATLTVGAELVVPANPVLQDGIPDVVQLSYLNEPGILYNLGHRYNLDHIYTWAGPVLIALNPCKPLPLYTPEIAAEYKRKTETTKKAMQYFATLAGGTGVEDQVLETNPVLEAFGNAKTLRNHNSSRFGKLIQIHFNGSHHICGATIKTYLLEKSRVVLQLKGERSFHIFYQLVRGVTDEERRAFMLPPKPQDFHFLAQSGCYDIAGVDDAEEFRVVRRALEDIGVDKETQAMLFKLLSGLLWLGNIEFEESGTGDSTKVRQTPALGNAATLLGWSQEALITALTTRRIVAPGEVVIKLLKVGDALEARNSLAKAIYAAIFNWVVARINARLSSGKSTSGLYIAILDIYGFEQFDRNSFEQLCINYANERLQQQFTHHLFKLEQTEYESEGVDWTKVEFIDNQDCVDIFELMPPKGLGMLAVLDSQCKFPRATDATLHMQLLEALSSRSHFGTNPRVPGSFIIRHYAGAVQYDTTGLLDKNKDTLSAGMTIAAGWILGVNLVQLMSGSSKPLMAELGASIQEEAERSTKKGQTVITRFGQQLRELVFELDTTGLHFVRCIKPNAKLLPNTMDSVATLHQLRRKASVTNSLKIAREVACAHQETRSPLRASVPRNPMEMLSVARVSAAGFPTRYRLEEFASRYSQLLPPEEQRLLQQQQGSAGSRQVCLTLLERFGLRVGQYQLGHTKVFFRPGVLGLVEDRWARMQAAVLTLQSWWRMYMCRVSYLKTLQAATVMQALWRTRVAALAYKELAAQHAAAVVFQSAWRMHSARSHFLRVKRAVITIQTKGYRAWKFGRWLSRAMQADRAELAAEEVRVKSKLEADWFSALRAEYHVSMEDVPTALAAWRAMNMSTLQEALASWRAAREAPQTREAATEESRPLEAKAVPGAASDVPAHAATAVVIPEASNEVAATTTSSGGAAAQPLQRPPVMIMTPAVVTPAVVNRFELAQELAIQVERLNLENVKLQKQLQLERGLTQRYQHKCEEQSVNWLEQVRLLQAYIQKCRTMLGDNLLPPLPKQVAALTQPVEDGPSVGKFVSAVDAAMMASMASHKLSPITGAAEGGVAVTAESSAVGAVGARHSTTSVCSATQTEAEQGILETPSVAHLSTQTVTELVTTGVQQCVPSSTFATQTDLLAMELPTVPLPSVGSVAVGTQTPQEIGGTAIGTQTPGLPETATVATETDAEAAVVVPSHAAIKGALSSDNGQPFSNTPGPRSSAFANPSIAEQVVGACNSPSPSMASEPVSLERDPSSVGGAHSPRVGSEARTNPSSTVGGASVNGGMPSTSAASAAPVNASQRYVAKLGEELERVMQVLPDDVAFIREVHEGQVLAPEMDPGVELYKLKKKFDVWKREFKEKLRTTEEVLHKIERMEGRPSHSHGHAPHAGRDLHMGANDSLRPSQSVRIAGPPVGGPSSMPAPRYAAAVPGPPMAGMQQRPVAVPDMAPRNTPPDSSAATNRRKGSGSSKLLNKLFNNNAR